MEVPAVIKQHPILTVGGIIVGGIILFTLIHSGSSGGSVQASGGVDPTIAAATIQAQTQASHDASTLQANRDNLAAQIALQGEQGSDAITAAQIAAATTLGQTQAYLALQKYATDASVTTQLATIKASTDQLNISTAGQVDLSQITSNTYLGLSHDSTAAQIAAVNAQRDTSIAYVNAQTKQAKSKNNAGVLGGLISLAGAFL